jgi:hypothetical protein
MQSDAAAVLQIRRSGAMYEIGRSIGIKAATVSASCSRALQCTIATIPDGDNPVPCARHLCRSLSVLQGGLTIMYSDASFQYSLLYHLSRIEASGQSLTCSTNEMCFRAAR